MKNWSNCLLNRIRIAGQVRRSCEGWLFVRIFLFAAAVPWLFRLKFSRANRWLQQRLKTGNPASPGQCAQIIQSVEWTMALGSPLIKRTCLTRGVTLLYFLRKAGLNVNLCFGAAMKAGRCVEAPGHCWLVKDGQPFLELNDPRPNFLPIYQFPQDHSKSSPHSGF